MTPPRAPQETTRQARPLFAVMNRVSHDPKQLIAVVVVTVFLSQIAIMFTLASIPEMSMVAGALVDAGLQSLILAVVLILFVYRPFKGSIEDRDRALNSLMESEKRFQDIAEHANNWIWEVDATGRYTYASPVVEQILGFTPEEILQKHFYDLFHPDDRELLKQEAFKVIASKRSFHGYINRNVHKDGRSVWLSTSGIPVLGKNGELLGYRGCDEAKYQDSSVLDILTGVLNRRGFYLVAGQQIILAIRNNLPIVLLFADMDNLKVINDELGHAAGDQALRDVAEILKHSARESDVVARYGGDEFVVLLTGVREQDVKRVVLPNINNHIDEFNRLENKQYKMSVSIGYSAHETESVCTLDELILRADRWMYRRKRANRRTSASTDAAKAPTAPAEESREPERRSLHRSGDA